MIDPDEDYRRLSAQGDGSDKEISKGMLITGAIFWIGLILGFVWFAYS